MKKLALTLAALALSAAPAVAKERLFDRSPSILECGIFFIPANCSPLDRIVGGAIVGGALGFGVGAIVGAAGGAIAGGTFDCWRCQFLCRDRRERWCCHWSSRSSLR